MAEQKILLRQLLIDRNINAVREWADKRRNGLRVLFSLTFDPDELVRWRAIEAVGDVAKIQAANNMDKIRDFIRRLLWLMNDESGGLGWHAPEAIGEILANIPTLINEYAKLIPHYFGEEPFERGAHYAAYRISSISPGALADHAQELLFSIGHQDPVIRAYATCSLVLIDSKKHYTVINTLLDDRSPMTTYNVKDGCIVPTDVGSMIGDTLIRNR